MRDAGAIYNVVMAALVAAIHVLLFCCCNKDVDGRDKPGHDDARGILTSETRRTSSPESAHSA